MIWFIDNDALLKLAIYDLLDTTLTILNIQPKEIRVLATAKYVLLPANQRLRHCDTTECANRLESFLSNATEFNANNLDGNILDVLSSKPNIDAGEAVIFAMAASHPNARILTGDKRALTTLGRGEDLESIRNALAGRVLSLEMLFISLVEKDFAQVQTRVRRHPSTDKALTLVFGHSAPADLDSILSALNSYVEDLRRQTGMLLPPSPISF